VRAAKRTSDAHWHGEGINYQRDQVGAVDSVDDVDRMRSGD
jgi:hypothetical protein